MRMYRCILLYVMRLRPPESTRTDTLFPYTTLFRSHHVGLARIVEVGLDRAGSQHHVEAETADARHVIEHDLVAPLGHDRQFGARLVGPHADAEETEPEFGADFLHLLQMPAGLGAGLVEVFERGAGAFELPRGFEADGAVAARPRPDVHPSELKYLMR